jgi:GH15 family glucan-1,4-alpha-glucosidase
METESLSNVNNRSKAMKTNCILTVLLVSFFQALVTAQQFSKPVEPSYFKLTTSNGLIAGVYNAKENRIDDVYPHIFANYDSGKYVHPFVGNIVLTSAERPTYAGYFKNTHVIIVRYDGFTVNYFSSFTNNDIIFYIVVRGEKNTIEHLTFNAETEKGQAVSGITLLENHLEELPIHIAGNILTGSIVRRYREDVYEKYFLYSFTDSLHTDTAIVSKAIVRLAGATTSLLDEEVTYMRNCFSACTIPHELSAKERNVVEQSIAILRMSQVSDEEIFPHSHGQILASLRPGLWHIAWVRDGSYAIQAMTRLGMFAEARKGLEFMLKAPSGHFKHYVYTDGKDYGPGVDYQISLTRYFGNGVEECDYNEFGPNIEFDNFGLFLSAYCDYVLCSQDSAFYNKWNQVVCTKVADATICCIDTNSLIKADSGPWEHHLQLPKQYTFTSAVCARGLELFALLQKQYHLPYDKYRSAAETLKRGIFTHMLCENKYIKGNGNDQLKTDHEYYDSGVYESFANGLINDKDLFLSHMHEYDKVLRIKGNRPGYIRLNTADPYENQEWVFINLRIARAYLLFGEKDEAAKLLNFVTEQAAVNNNTIPEMYSNRLQMEKVTDNFKSSDIWCNCIRDKDDQYIGTIPMVGYGSAAYILTLYDYYAK